MPEAATFTLVMIKPTRYDLDGYPIQWLKSLIPSNTLAAVNGLAEDCRRRQVLGPDVEIRLKAYDEVNTRIRPDRIIRDIEATGGRALIALVGVQSNQFPRAVDLARPFLAAGLPVSIGGFHVAGCISMLDELPREIVEAQEMGISIFAGEAEEQRLDQVMRDAYAGQLKPVYDYMKDLPNLKDEPTPILESGAVHKTVNKRTSFDLGRGCPFQCSFCTIINVQGRKSRYRSPDDVERIIRENAALGIHNFFITDDNFARNVDWEPLLDRMIHLRENEGIHLNLIIQVDTLCHKLPRFIEKSARAGVKRVFIGLENINPDNLLAAKKRQNKITEYRKMLLEWRAHGVFTYAGYILGFPQDTKASILRDIEIIKKELPIDVLEFFFLTPLPGSEDHKTLLKRGVWMDPDLNRYNLHHRVSHHDKMSDAEWEDAYDQAWRCYFDYDHIETIIRRHAARPNGQPRRAMRFVREFRQIFEVERIHPLEGGILRLKSRRDRRPGMPIEHPLLFYPKFVTETVRKLAHYAFIHFQCDARYRRVMKDADRLAYRDTAITPVADDDEDKLAIFHDTFGGEAAVKRMQRQRALTEKTVRPAPAEPVV